MLLKDLTGAEGQHVMTLERWCSTTLRAHKRACYDFKHERTRLGTGEETVAPCALREETYPAWFGGIDSREVVLYHNACSGYRKP